MKIQIRLSCNLFTDEEKDFWHEGGNVIEMDWDIPMFPRVKEGFNLKSIVSVNTIPDYYDTVTWHVSEIEYSRIKGIITPLIWLVGV